MLESGRPVGLPWRHGARSTGPAPLRRLPGRLRRRLRRPRDAPRAAVDDADPRAAAGRAAAGLLGGAAGEPARGLGVAVGAAHRARRHLPRRHPARGPGSRSPWRAHGCCWGARPRHWRARSPTSTRRRCPPCCGSLPERLHAVPSWAGRVALVDRTLAALAAHAGDPAPRAEVAHALSLLTTGTRVEAAAAEVGYSRRRLGSLVRAECGVTPKAYQRIARLEAARRVLGRRPLAEVALRCGYADQAHLTREWSALAGCTPTTWLREEFPFLQDPDRPGGAGSSHD
ncbi:AraC family transcriptional regulator [Nocardioides convexus]|uniref:helix-turn-helix domain-containing protein n=1 Tax=Nocardioides convexus TaxID=2712224 RepID=UPI00241873F8|nr:AraC family transcriptional regulator [Nocardioides convexus]